MYYNYFPNAVEFSYGFSRTGKGAFSGCKWIGSVSIRSQSLASIGSGSFQDSENLSEVSIGGCVPRAVIGSSAFQRCPNLSKINLPEGIERLESFAFFGCSSLKSLVLPASLKFVGNGALSGGFDALYFKGDAPQVEEGGWEPQVTNCIYVKQGTSGWGKVGEETWHGCPTAYW